MVNHWEKIVITWAIVLVSSAWSDCPKGCVENEGVCACDQKPVDDVAPTIQPSDERPPQSGMPSWQAEGIKADTPGSLAAQDAKQDAEKVKADSEGKKAAGL